MTSSPSGNVRRSALSIPSLDGLRGVSFLIVFVGHVGSSAIPVAIPGGFGVTVFFFLSGYLITTLLRLELEQHGRINFKHFYFRRALRIWPPFYLVLALSSVLTVTGVLTGTLEWQSLAAQALHYANFWLIEHGSRGMPPGSVVYWSLAVEEHFYLIFPALYAGLARLGLGPSRQRLVLLGLCAAILLWRMALALWLGASFDRTYMASDARFDSMLFGCALAVCDNPALDLPPKDRPGASDYAFLGAGVLLLLASFVIRDDLFRRTLRYTLQGFGLFPIFITAVRFPTWAPYRLLNYRPMRYLGTISFSLYLVHETILIGLAERTSLGTNAKGGVALVLSIAVASAIWIFVERPCAALRRRLGHVKG